MNKQKAIAVFDIGKTNKKFFVFSPELDVLHHQQEHFHEILDDDGEACEDLHALTAWMRTTLASALASDRYEIAGVNCSAYGASLVHTDDQGAPVAPLYNYLKPYPASLQHHLHTRYGGADAFSLQTASPVLGSLNSGLQLYRIKEEKPELFGQIHRTYHLPQYLAGLFHGHHAAESTSIGCHTAFWNFSEKQYHRWVKEEGLLEKLGPLESSTVAFKARLGIHDLLCGIGLHDSSAALVPYLLSQEDPFVLLSTGTWNIALNPFNQDPLTLEELRQDCLCYLSYQQQPVKASRLFAGHHHEEITRRLASHFEVGEKYFETISLDPRWDPPSYGSGRRNAPGREPGSFSLESWPAFEASDFINYSQAYHQLIGDIVERQIHSLRLIAPRNGLSRILVDGGFSQNPLFMQMLAHRLPHCEIFAAEIAQASALGAALALTPLFSKIVPSHLLRLQRVGTA